MKKTSILLALSLMCLAQGCKGAAEADRETLEIKKDGSIVETVRESFEEDYYNVDDLKAYITEELNSYNEDFEEVQIALTDCTVKRKIAQAVLTYQDVEDYMAFNQAELFVGDLAALSETSYHDSVNLKNKKDETVSLSHLIASGESYQSVVVTQSCEVIVSGKIAYVSDNVEILSGKSANVSLNDEACAYIIYK